MAEERMQHTCLQTDWQGIQECIWQII